MKIRVFLFLASGLVFSQSALANDDAVGPCLIKQAMCESFYKNLERMQSDTLFQQTAQEIVYISMRKGVVDAEKECTQATGDFELLTTLTVKGSPEVEIYSSQPHGADSTCYGLLRD